MHQLSHVKAIVSEWITDKNYCHSQWFTDCDSKPWQHVHPWGL